ncbi:legumain-like [Neoarius graeffei]|uniref:legumain-like n=1 Tax=Neoarius graeffei TaxID=443677 RepID=UPI00298D2FF8|nr:legumain-like [Neoarius graeffei]
MADPLGKGLSPLAPHLWKFRWVPCTKAPILKHPDPAKPFTVEADASETGVGGILSQCFREKPKLHPVAFFSRKLTPAKQNLLVIKLATEEWRHRLKGATHPFIILTDHKNLEYLVTAPLVWCLNIVVDMGGSYSKKQWVLLVAGSKGWENYRHQANVCHAYQIAQQNGVPDEQIVVMMYDDIAKNKENPVYGNVINVPNGPNVYPGVPKDYTGEDVSAENFLAVVRGDSSAVKKTGPKKVIQSGKYDSIFIYLSDHGAHGIFGFPHSTLYAHDLINTVNTMSWSSQFSKMVIYLESCHAGSMLDKLSDRNVYSVGSCKPDEFAYAWFWDKERNTYLADVFSTYWLHHTETVKLSLTSFEDQFSYLKKNVSKAVRKDVGKTQTPCNYGYKGMLKLMLSEFLGQSSAPVSEVYTSQPLNIQESDVVDATEVPLIIQENRIKNEQDPEKRQVLERQYEDLKRKRKTVDEALQKIAEHINASRALTGKCEVTRTYELKVVAEHFRKNLFNWDEEPFVITHSHLQVLVNLCECGLEVESIIEAITQVSQEITF